MRIRWKILAVLLAISTLPMIILRWNAARLFHSLAGELADQAGNALYRQSTQALKRLVEDHARVLKREGQLIEMALEVQSTELENRISGPAAPTSPDAGGYGGVPAVRKPTTYCRLGPDGECEPLIVSHGVPRWTLPPDMDPAKRDQLVGQTRGMAAVWEAFDREFPGLFLWQVMVLESGVQSVYPGPAAVSIDDGRDMPWYRQVKRMDAVVWSMPIVDPLTREIVIPVAAPIQGAGGVFLGAVAVMVPVSTLLHENQHIRRLSEHVTSLLVRAEPRSEAGPEVDRTGIQVLASESVNQARHEGWRYLDTVRWLSSDTPGALDPVIDDLMKRRSGISEVPHEGQTTLMAYSVISAEGTSLLLIVPKSDLIAEAEEMERYVQDRLIEEMKKTGTMISVVLFGVFLLSFVLSRYVTKNIRKLLDGSRRLATGDFTTRIDIRSRDEIGELGRAFNRMVPALEERIRLKQGIEVASSVQQSLLPKHPPRLSGFDIAAISRYCDETGGDFYDFIALNRGGPPGLGIAVGDVSGHGISAALLMATTRAFLKGRVTQPGSLAQMIGDVNRLLCRDTDDTGQFVTLFFMEMGEGADTLDWVRAGHDPGVVYDPESDAFFELKGVGAALGVDAHMAWAANRLMGLKAGRIIAVGTDGIWESRNAPGEMFGKARFKASIRSRRDNTAAEILAGVVSDLDAFRGGEAQSDDVTLVIVKVEG
ncbi:SpoIIE family protein phosphatase [Desulfococcus sp.]|uniref:SpoIIE family protein phosphatase n=1 Tax=Desulfococcus sp. TaxID=2025834 RepID=UPI0035930326